MSNYLYKPLQIKETHIIMFNTPLQLKSGLNLVNHDFSFEENQTEISGKS